MTTEIICALITAFGTVLSAIIAWCVSRFTVKKNIEQMELSWKREDIVSSNDDFAEMAAEVAEYIAKASGGYLSATRVSSISKVAAIRVRETGQLAAALDALYVALSAASPPEVDTALTEVIEQKRKHSRCDD